jgi:hypothetical protein
MYEYTPTCCGNLCVLLMLMMLIRGYKKLRVSQFIRLEDRKAAACSCRCFCSEWYAATYSPWYSDLLREQLVEFTVYRYLLTRTHEPSRMPVIQLAKGWLAMCSYRHESDLKSALLLNQHVSRACKMRKKAPLLMPSRSFLARPVSITVDPIFLQHYKFV